MKAVVKKLACCRVAKFSVVLLASLPIFAVAADRVPANSNLPPAQDSQGSPTQQASSPNQVLEMRGDILMARKEYDLAITAYGEILKKQPKNAVVLNKMGIAYQQLGNGDEAEHYYRKSMSADKRFSIPINNLGTLEYGKQHYGNAIKLYLKAARLRVNVAPIYSNLAYAYYANKQYPEAMNAFGKALAADPQIFDRKTGGGGSVLQQRTAPDPGELFFLMAKSYAKLGDAEHTAHYLKMARDDGYAKYAAAEKDPAFGSVIKDPRVQEVLKVTPSYIAQPDKPVTE